mmetsp:Transcript_14134/g.61645  ORF Transcript_14134/g.61645 Transcript_14134/m.61645 type:complete len:477 (-) Transcript_14134:121-1551(-)
MAVNRSHQREVVQERRHLARDLAHPHVEVRREVPTLVVRRERLALPERRHVRHGRRSLLQPPNRRHRGFLVSDEPVGLAGSVLARPSRVHRLVHLRQHRVGEDAHLRVNPELSVPARLHLELARGNRRGDARVKQLGKTRRRRRRVHDSSHRGFHEDAPDRLLGVPGAVHGDVRAQAVLYPAPVPRRRRAQRLLQRLRGGGAEGSLARVDPRREGLHERQLLPLVLQEPESAHLRRHALQHLRAVVDDVGGRRLVGREDGFERVQAVLVFLGDVSLRDVVVVRVVVAAEDVRDAEGVDDGLFRVRGGLLARGSGADLVQEPLHLGDDVVGLEHQLERRALIREALLLLERALHLVQFLLHAVALRGDLRDELIERRVPILHDALDVGQFVGEREELVEISGGDLHELALDDLAVRVQLNLQLLHGVAPRVHGLHPLVDVEVLGLERRLIEPVGKHVRLLVVIRDRGIDLEVLDELL